MPMATEVNSRPCARATRRAIGSCRGMLSRVGGIGGGGAAQRAGPAKVSLNSLVHFVPSSMNLGRSTKIRSFGTGPAFGLVGTESRSTNIFWPSLRKKSCEQHAPRGDAAPA